MAKKVRSTLWNDNIKSVVLVIKEMARNSKMKLIRTEYRVLLMFIASLNGVI
jgi:hypothetical protein